LISLEKKKYKIKVPCDVATATGAVGKEADSTSALEMLRNFETVQAIKSHRSGGGQTSPIYYEKLDDLRGLIDLKCNCIELKFKLLILDELINVYLNDILANAEKRLADTRFTQYVNILFSLVFEKRTMIAR
jgi:hypothetical protein